MIAPRILYLFGHYCKSLLWHVSCVLFAFYLTEQCQLSPMAMALVFGSSLGCNAVIDGFTGHWLKRRGGTMMGTGRYQMIGAATAGLAFILFAASSFLPPEWRLFWALASLTAFRCSYPLLDVAQNALGACLATTAAGHRQIVAQRHIVSGLAGVSIAFGVAPSLIAGGKHASMAFLACAIVIAALACIGALVQPTLDARQTKEVSPEEAGAGAAMSYSRALILIVAAGMGGTIFVKLAPYYLAFATPGIRHPVSLLGWMAIGNSGSQLLWFAARSRLSERAIGMVIGGVLLGGTGLMLVTARSIPLALDYIGLLVGAGSGGIGFLSWTGMMNSAGRSHPYLKAGIFTAASKAAQAIAIIALGLCLGAGDYRTAFADPVSLPSLLIALAPAALAVAVMVVTLPLYQPRTSRLRIRDAAPSGADRSGESAATSSSGFGAARPRRGGWLASGQAARLTIRSASERGNRPPRMTASQSSV
jgi:Na+/melibiose symporter-like transporter